MVIQEPNLGPQRGGVTGREREGMGTENLLLSLTPTLFYCKFGSFPLKRKKERKKIRAQPVTRATMSAHNAGRVRDGPCRGLNRA